MSGDVVTPFRDPLHDHDQCMVRAMRKARVNCEQQGLRLTPIRSRVLELIWQRHAPVKAYDLLDALRAERRGAAPPTVYRALDFLLEHGLIHRIESLNAFVGCGDPSRKHGAQFLICGNCQAVAELDDDEVGTLIADKAARLGFEVQWQTVEINGLCPDCAGERGKIRQDQARQDHQEASDQ
jgi:Fur family transcriptional regulator, zinc uptake regulator